MLHWNQNFEEMPLKDERKNSIFNREKKLKKIKRSKHELFHNATWSSPVWMSQVSARLRNFFVDWTTRGEFNAILSQIRLAPSRRCSLSGKIWETRPDRKAVVESIGSPVKTYSQWRKWMNCCLCENEEKSLSRFFVKIKRCNQSLICEWSFVPFVLQVIWRQYVQDVEEFQDQPQLQLVFLWQRIRHLKNKHEYLLH